MNTLSKTNPFKLFFSRLFSFFSVSHMSKNTELHGELPSTGELYRKFLKVAWPSAIESFLICLVGVIDTIMVSKLGEEAIAAVGITNQPKFIVLAVIFSLNVGVTAVVARRKGEEDRISANRTLRVAILVSFCAVLLTGTVAYIYAEPLLIFCGAEDIYLADAITYFRIICIGLLFTALNITINAAHRGAGYTKISMRTNIIANLVNVLFNYLLINGIWIFPRLEIRGAAIATALGGLASCIISFCTLFSKKYYLNFFQKVGKFSFKEILAPVFKVSSSAFVEQVFMRIGFLLYAIMVAKLGTTQYATHLVCMNISTLSFSFGDGFAIAASALVGQNLGAQRPDLSKLYGKTGQRIAFIASTILFILFIVLRHPIIGLFSDEAAIIALGGNVMLLLAASTHFQTSQIVLNGCLRGAGDTAFVATASLISIAVVRPVLTWILCFPAGLGLYGAWLSLFFDHAFRFVSAFIRFNNNKWVKIKL